MQPIVNSIDRFVMVIKQWVEVVDEKGERESGGQNAKLLKLSNHTSGMSETESIQQQQKKVKMPSHYVALQKDLA